METAWDERWPSRRPRDAGRIRRFMAWLGYGPEMEPDERRDRDRRRTRGKAEAAERRARRRAERLERREDRRAGPEQAEPDGVQEASAPPHQTPVASAAAESARRLCTRRSACGSRHRRARAALGRDGVPGAFRGAEGVGGAGASCRCRGERRPSSRRSGGGDARHRGDLYQTRPGRRRTPAARAGGPPARVPVRGAERALDVEREEKTAIVEHFDRRLAAIEETADAAAKRVTAAERELIKGSSRPWFDEGVAGSNAPTQVRTATPWRRSNPASAATSPKGMDARVDSAVRGAALASPQGPVDALGPSEPARAKIRIKSAASARAGARRTAGLARRAPGWAPPARKRLDRGQHRLGERRRQ